MDERDLTSVLTKLQEAGALILPRRATVEKAERGKVWSGKKANGELWTLTKNAQEDYVCTF
jgi:hypothetical protein